MKRISEGLPVISMTGRTLFMTFQSIKGVRPHVAGTFYDLLKVVCTPFMTKTGEDLYGVKLKNTYGTFYDFRWPELFMTIIR